MIRELAAIRRNGNQGHYASPSHPRDIHQGTISRPGLPLQ
jgi:hypothetical protein